eukprot:6936708-Pyramimonas_sp.AAC.1
MAQRAGGTHAKAQRQVRHRRGAHHHGHVHAWARVSWCCTSKEGPPMGPSQLDTRRPEEEEEEGDGNGSSDGRQLQNAGS